jgi:hypothetical protein
MGQYYRPIFLKGKKSNKPEFTFNAFAYDNGQKLMEHSYIGNYLCLAVMYNLLNNAKRLVWAGDYADGEGGEDKPNLYSLSYEQKGCKTECKEISPDTLPTYNELQEMFSKPVLVINHTKKVYFEMQPASNKLVINPIPLLTVEGNGRGGGDYFGTNDGMVGTWARNEIEISSETPEGYSQINEPMFKESY